MFITKYGHCCMLLEESEMKILTDPGNFTEYKVKELNGIDALLITHEHQDHFHMPSIKDLLKNNPNLPIITNASVAALLQKEGITENIHLVSEGTSMDFKGLNFTAIGHEHAEIYKTLPSVENTGFIVGEDFYYPGDGFAQAGKLIVTVALPVIAPWMKLSECVDFALATGAKKFVPVHDGFFAEGQPNLFQTMTRAILKANGLELLEAPIGQRFEV
jgi:L-ascorbate metabolism protein UlaG (beta-lactamase superfamily)